MKISKTKVTIKPLDGLGNQVLVTVTYATKASKRVLKAVGKSVSVTTWTDTFVYETEKDTPEMFVYMCRTKAPNASVGRQLAKPRDILARAKNLKKLQAVCKISPFEQRYWREYYVSLFKQNGLKNPSHS